MVKVIPTREQVFLVMMRMFLSAATIFVSLTAAPAPDPSQAILPSEDFSISFSRHKLRNGLEVILAEDGILPVVSVSLAYRVGSVNESPGKSGLAYLIEKLMMFHGSLNVSPMQHISAINRVGGETSASTTKHVTFYYQTVPSNQLDLVLWLESDRMMSLDITPAKVERAKGTQLDDIQDRKEADPFLASSFAFDELVYPDYAHSHPLIGVDGDIRDLTVEDVRNFFSTYYVPNNAVMVIVGRFDRMRTLEHAEKYFGSIPRGKDVPFAPAPDLGEKTETVRTIQDPLLPSSAFYLAYRIAPPYSDDFAALTLLDYILMKGRSSRLPRRLLKESRLASAMSGGIERQKDSAVFKICAVATNEDMAAECQKAFHSEINRFKTAFISVEELNKAKQIYRMETFRRLATTLDKSVFLSEMFFLHPRFDELSKDLSKVMKVMPEEISRIVQRYFVPRNLVLLNVNRLK